MTRSPAGPRRPPDQSVRDLLVQHLTGSVFVEAGAGSGKTTAVVERIHALVVTGTLRSIEQLAAITFTEAAAAELRHRIRARLETTVGDPDVSDPARSRARAALDGLDDAAITTIHGFALRILSQFPIEAGLPPGFAVAEDVASVVARREAWEEFLDTLYADESAEPLLRRALLLGLRPNQLGGIADAFREHVDRLTPDTFPDVPLAPLSLAEVVSAFRAVAATACVAADAGDVAARTSDPDALDEFVLMLESVPADSDDQLALLVDWAPKPRKTKGKSPEALEFRAAVDHLETVQSEVLSSLRRNALLPLLRRIAGYTLEQAARRRTDGHLEFADLLVLAVELLRRDAGVRVAVGEQWRRIVVDEFQDTDPLQLELVVLAAMDDPVTPPGPWTEVSCREGALTFVGDPKQAIYRFRGADIEAYLAAAESFAADGPLSLSTCFRSDPRIIEWVNTVFPSLFEAPGNGSTGVRQVAYQALDTHRDPLDAEVVPVTVLGGPVADVNAAEIRALEARHLVAHVAELQRAGLTVEVDGVARPARFADITFLIPTRAVLGELERALDAAGVPYRIEARSLVYGTEEVHDLRSLLRAVDDPGDEVAVVASLRSVAFACGDDELVEYVRAGGRFGRRGRHLDDVATALRPDHPVVQGLRTIRELHERRSWLPVDELVAEVLRRCELFEVTTARRRPRDHARRYRLVLDDARAFVAAGGRSLGAFVDLLDQRSAEGEQRIETVVSELDDDAVRITTIHGAKGLEYPIVVLAGLGTPFQMPSDRVFWRAGRPEVRIGNVKEGRAFDTDGYETCRKIETAHEYAERLRLLYVAATRARDHLIISRYHKATSGEPNCLAALLPDPATAAATIVGALPGPEAVELVPTTANAGPGLPAVADPIADLEAFVATRAADVARWSRPTVLAPTAVAAARREAGTTPHARDDVASDAATVEPLGDGLADGTDTISDVEPAERTVIRQGRGGTAIGRAVHAVLQHADLTDPASLAPHVAAQCLAEGVPGDVVTVAALAESARRSPSVQAALTSTRSWRELHLSVPLGSQGGLLEGYVDLLYEQPDGRLVVVDYKTDRARTRAEIEAAAAGYRLQAAAYAAALERATGREVARCVFVFARVERGEPADAVEVEVADLAAAVDEIVAIMDAA